jgi:hypothetical protein
MLFVVALDRLCLRFLLLYCASALLYIELLSGCRNTNIRHIMAILTMMKLCVCGQLHNKSSRAHAEYFNKMCEFSGFILIVIV